MSHLTVVRLLSVIINRNANGWLYHLESISLNSSVDDSERRPTKRARMDQKNMLGDSEWFPWQDRIVSD